MKEYIPDQLRAVLVFFLSGAALGVIRDFLRFIGMTAGSVPVPRRPKCAARRGTGKRQSRLTRIVCQAAVFFADVLFCLFVTAVFAVMTYAFCGGKFRSYSFFSAAAGFYLYSVFPGKPVRIPLEWAAYHLNRALGAAVRFVADFLRRLISAALKSVSKPIVSLIRRAREAMRIRSRKKKKGTLGSPDDTRETVYFAGRRRSF